MNTDRLKHLTHLKYLNLHSDIVDQYYVAQDGQIGILLSYRTDAVSWDQSLYPDSYAVLLPTASDQDCAEQVFDYVRENLLIGKPLVIKFCDRLTKSVFLQHMPLRYADAYLSYTAGDNVVFDLPDQVVITTQLTDSCATLYMANGYDRKALETYFAQGAISFVINEGASPVATCMAYHNFDTIWEIAGVRTIDSARQKGYGRLVVQAALHTLLKQGKAPRYIVSANNLPSIRLAERLGLRQCLSFEHFVYQPT